MSSKNFNFVSSFQKQRENSFNSSLKQYHLGSMSVFKLKDVLISLILSFLLLLGVVFPISSTTAQNYDIVIETEINEQTVKIIEINFSEDIVHFYKFFGDGNPIYEGGEQVKFVPGDKDFEEYVANLSGALIVNALTIQSNEEFSFQIYYGNLSDWEMVLQLCYDSGSNYRLYEHHELDEPFDANSQIGDFSILFVGEETYTGYKYSIDPLDEKWNRTNIQEDNTFSSQETKILFKVDSKTISIYENNEEREVSINYPVIIKDGRSMVESHFLLKYWHFGKGLLAEYVTDTEEVRFIFLDNEDNELVIIVDTKNKIGKAFYNDNELKMDVIPFQPTGSEKLIAVSHFVLPIRFIFETFGYTVEWNNDTREITVYR